MAPVPCLLRAHDPANSTGTVAVSRPSVKPKIRLDRRVVCASRVLVPVHEQVRVLALKVERDAGIVRRARQHGPLRHSIEEVDDVLERRAGGDPPPCGARAFTNAFTLESSAQIAGLVVDVIEHAADQRVARIAGQEQRRSNARKPVGSTSRL